MRSDPMLDVSPLINRHLFWVSCPGIIGEKNFHLFMSANFRCIELTRPRRETESSDQPRNKERVDEPVFLKKFAQFLGINS